MIASPPNPLFDEVFDFLISAPTPEQIIAFKPSAALQARASELLERNRSAQLTGDEQRELAAFTQMNDFMSMMKIRARQKLAGS